MMHTGINMCNQAYPAADGPAGAKKPFTCGTGAKLSVGIWGIRKEHQLQVAHPLWQNAALRFVLPKAQNAQDLQSH